MEESKKDELIRKQREQIDNLEQALTDKLGANEDKLNGMKQMFEGMPEIDKIKESAAQLEKASKAIAPIVELISKMDPEKLKELLRK